MPPPSTTATLLDDRLDARVFTRERLDARGLFGGSLGPAARRRCGDVVVVPREEAAWYDDGGDVGSLVGMHGGLSPAEILVPFAAARLSTLQ